ncbi:hypothetical protein U1Q18_035941, partial [Sarracenia purpurea var. burkii]
LVVELGDGDCEWREFIVEFELGIGEKEDGKGGECGHTGDWDEGDKVGEGDFDDVWLEVEEFDQKKEFKC